MGTGTDIVASVSDRRRSWLKRLVAGPWRDRVDLKYGVDTSGEIQPDELGVALPSAAFAYCYRPTLGWVIRLFIRRLPIDQRSYQFIDFGSGKGRALLVASEFAFTKVVGIEFCESLHDIAVENIRRIPESKRQNGRVVSIFADAVSFALPKSNLVCYLYNPFAPPVLDQVLEKLIAHRREGFDVYAIYINSKHLDAFQKTGAFREIFRHQKGVLLKVDEPKP